MAHAGSTSLCFSSARLNAETPRRLSEEKHRGVSVAAQNAGGAAPGWRSDVRSAEPGMGEP